MTRQPNKDLENWKVILLLYARHFADRESRKWFSMADVLTTYVSALNEYASTGDVKSGLGRLVSNLPKDDASMLDSDKVSAVCELLMADGLLADAKNHLYTDSKTITPEGRKYLALHELDLKAETAEPAARVVIVTIRDDEYMAVFNRLPGTSFFDGKHRTYVHASFAHESGASISAYLIKTTEQGPNAAQDTTRDAIEDLDPNLIVVSGIAGAVPDTEFSLGDVIAVNRLHDFVVGAAKDAGVIEVADQGGPAAKRVQDLLSLLPALSSGPMAYWRDASEITMQRPTTVTTSADKLYGDSDWQRKVTESVARNFGQGTRDYPLATSRAIASSGMLVKDAKLIQRWMESSREICAVEMELSGVYSAARRPDKDYPILAVRGISDVIGLKRDGHWTAYACQTAASLTMALLKHAPLRLISGKSA